MDARKGEMGHDTTLYELPKEELKEVGYLRRSAGSKNRVYEIMGLESYNAGVSGDGSYHVIYAEDYLSEVDGWIKEAKEETAWDEVEKDLVQFFKDMKEQLKKNGKVLLHLG